MKYGRELPGHPFNFKALMTRGIIVFQRKIFSDWLRNSSDHAKIPVSFTREETQVEIRNMLTSDSPKMVSRFGSYEMEATLRSIDVTAPESVLKKTYQMLFGKRGPFWWDNSIRGGLVWNAGFFPPTNDALNQFGKKVIEDCKLIDLLGSSVAGEKRMQKLFVPNMKATALGNLSPIVASNPWTQALEGKKVLVVHPFTNTIQKQFQKRQLLFQNPMILPDFELITYKPVVTLAGNQSEFETWFEALDHMCNEISTLRFEIAIVGAGAFGMSIAAHIKRMERKVVHLGGETQILFGIKGKRWDERPSYTEIYNEHWTRPLPEDTPANTKTVEGGCYW